MRYIQRNNKKILRTEANRCPKGHLLDTYKGISVCQVCIKQRQTRKEGARNDTK